MENKEFIEAIIELCEELGLDSDSLTNHYSGRFMFGERCFGVTVPDLNDGLRACGAAGLPKPSTDNMGLSFIIYWPERLLAEEEFDSLEDRI